MDPSSPAKRRALAPLDANTRSPAPKSQLGKPGSPLKSPLRTSPAPKVLEPRKRPLEEVQAEEGVAKKQCQEPEDAPREAGRGAKDGEENDDAASPDTSSVFDTSAIDTSLATTITEPDMEQARILPPVRPRPAALLTREQARQKAEILRLRLGLANYKLRTGQADVPLDQLQLRPMPGHRRVPTVKVSSPRAEVQESDMGSSQESKDGDKEDASPSRPAEQLPLAYPSPEKSLLPRLPAAGLNTPQRRRGDEDKLTSSALRGGAVSGLLSLARGSP